MIRIGFWGDCGPKSEANTTIDALCIIQHYTYNYNKAPQKIVKVIIKAPILLLQGFCPSRA